MKPNKIGECGVHRKFPSHIVSLIYGTIGPHGPSSSIEFFRCSIESVVIILKLNSAIKLKNAWSSIRQGRILAALANIIQSFVISCSAIKIGGHGYDLNPDEFSGVTSVTMRLSVMDATEVAKKGIATGCDRKRCLRPVESRVGSRIKMKANKLRSCCCDGKCVGEFGARDSCSIIRYRNSRMMNHNRALCYREEAGEGEMKKSRGEAALILCREELL
ncbi:hypothetical protein SADUNF_Sadunf17G0094300 [Salix dunnii]|uniref:Uncharacterized protein n=1 Tax=Salix dunnii TaxID=1413687 RepID=A0A835MHH2_9ROSI|nr:hypothetical protein SADUNF_Sadunf17G0094300 [Salix dunnii]